MARARRRQIDVRRELGRRLEQAGEHRGFREIHVARRLVEVILRRRIDAEGAAAHIGAVEVELQNLVLGQARFQPHRQEGFLDLAVERALVRQKQVLGELLRQRRAALHDAAGARIGDQRAHGAADIDAEMLVEAPVLGGEHRLDQIVGELVERHRVVVPDAARADLVAVAVEEGDRQFRFLQPVVVRGLVERRHRQRQHQHGAGGAQGGAFRHELVERAPPAGDVEAVHEGGEALVALARAGAAAEDAGIDPGVEPEHQLLEIGLPVLGEQVAQGFGRSSRKGAARLRPTTGADDRPAAKRQFSRSARLRPMPAGWLTAPKVNGNCGEKGAVSATSVRWGAGRPGAMRCGVFGGMAARFTLVIPKRKHGDKQSDDENQHRSDQTQDLNGRLS